MLAVYIEVLVFLLKASKASRFSGVSDAAGYILVRLNFLTLRMSMSLGKRLFNLRYKFVVIFLNVYYILRKITICMSFRL